MTGSVRKRTPQKEPRGRPSHGAYDRIFAMARNLAADEEYAHSIDEPLNMQVAILRVRTALRYRLQQHAKRGEYVGVHFSVCVEGRHLIIRRVDRD